MTDKQIIQYIKQGHYSTALKGLYNVLPVLKKYIKANSGTADDAQDIFQDALVVFCKKVSKEDLILTGTLQNYLFGIAKNCWRGVLRERKKIPIVHSDGDFYYENTEEGPEFMLAEAAFNLLGEKCRQLLILFYFHKNSYTKIADELKFSDDKVAKNQKYRCLQKAKENYVTLSKKGTHE